MSIFYWLRNWSESCHLIPSYNYYNHNLEINTNVMLKRPNSVVFFMSWSRVFIQINVLNSTFTLDVKFSLVCHRRSSAILWKAMTSVLDATMSSSLLWSLASCTGCQGFLVVVAAGEANIQVDQHPLPPLIWNSTADIRPALSYGGNAIMSKRPEETAPAALVSPPWLQSLCVHLWFSSFRKQNLILSMEHLKDMADCNDSMHLS